MASKNMQTIQNRFIKTHKMVKKIFKLFKKKSKKKKKIKEPEKAEIINFVNKSQKTNNIQTEQMESKKMDNLAKELVDNYIAGQQSMADNQLNQIYEAGGGKDGYAEVTKWASENLSEKEVFGRQLFFLIVILPPENSCFFLYAKRQYS